MWVVWVWWYGKAGGRVCLSACRIAENAQRLTACGCPCACGCACRPCPCRLFLSVRQCYLFNVDNICRMVGGILQPNGNRKTANSMCPLTLTPTPIFPNTELQPSDVRFGNIPNSGGEFRNVNQWDFLVSVKIIDKFSRTVGNFIEDPSVSQNRAHFT